MDEHHLTNDNTQHSTSTTNEDHNNNDIKQLNNKKANTQDTESMSSEVAQSQLCCSCRYEKAVFICTVCNESGLAANNFASSEKIADKTGAENTNVYFSPSNPTSPNIAESETQDEAKIPDAEVLMRRGNMVYCRECFKDVHKAMSNNHKPVEVFQRTQQVNLDDTNQDSIDIEEACNKEIKEGLSSIESANSNQTITENTPDNNRDLSENVQDNNIDISENTPDNNMNKANIIVELLNEMVSISSSNLEQEEREQDMRQNTTNSDLIAKQMEGLLADLSNLNVRCEQFNDVKASIKQMNDLIRNDLFMDFGTITTMIRVKLDEVTNNIKEKLKDAYSVVRDTQTRITNKITEIKALADRIQMLEALQKANSSPSNSAHNLSLGENRMSDEMILEEISLAYEKIRQINEDLRRITETSRYVNPSVSSIDSCSPTTSTSCSLFVDNSLYPKFNYFVDTRKLVEAINEIDVQIGSRDILNPKTYFLGNATEEDSHEPLKYSNNSNFFCMITSGISNEGSFWLQLNFKNDELELDPNHQVDRNNNNKINLFIEEISKYVRKKRIGDKSWQTYAEANRLPEPSEKCFCLEPKSRKWLRAKVVSFNAEEQVCQLRFMDTGNYQFESNKFPLDQVLVWKDFDLAMYPARTIKCVLYKECDNRYETDICLETKFFFKDSLANRGFKCELVEPLEEHIADNMPSDELTWIVKLHELNKPCTQETSINAQIIKYNEHERLVLENKAASRNKFSSIDIRVESGTVGTSSQLVKTHCSNENNNTNLVSRSSSFSASNTEKHTDSDSATRATCCTDDQAQIASSVNSFSEKFEAKEQQKQQQQHQVNKENNNTASSLPIIHSIDARQVDVDLELEAIKNNTMLTSKAESIANQASIELDDKPMSKVDSNNNDTSTLQCIVSPESMDPSATEENFNLDVEDQTSERRYYRDDHGICIVNNHIDQDGIFWIRPICNHNDIKQLSFFIGQFITKTQWKSYSELHIRPAIGKKCFFREATHKNDWARGLIESSYEDAALIRNLDTGRGHYHQWENIYPHRRLTSSNSNVPVHIPKYLAIRCVISREPVKLTKQSKEMFKNKINSRKIEKRFDLIDQVMVNNQKCWFTTIRQSDSPHASINTVNNQILDMQKNMPQSKSTDIITSLRINDDEQMNNAIKSSVSLQHQTVSGHSLTPDQNFLISQTINTIQKLNSMGAAYLLQPQLDQLKQVSQTEFQTDTNDGHNPYAARFIGQQHPQYQHSLPVYPGRDDSKKKKRSTRERRRQKETKDDLTLDSSFSDHPCGRRRSRSADSITKEDAMTDKNEIIRKLAAEHKKIPTDNSIKQANLTPTESNQAQKTFVPENSFHSQPHEFNKNNSRARGSGLQPAVGRNNKSSSDTNKIASQPNSKTSPGTSRKLVGRKPTPNAKDSCRDSGPQSNRYNRRYDDDDRDGSGSKPAWNSGGGISGGYSRPWRQNSQTGGSRQGGANKNGNNGKQKTAPGIYTASVLNHFPNNHTDCHVISPSASSQHMPYVVNWGYDENENNSSAFNDVFIEDNYCTTENDYDSNYGDDTYGLDEPISESEHPKSQYEFYENPIEFSDVSKRISMQSVSSDCLSKIRVTSLREISNASKHDEVDNISNSTPSKKQLSKTRCVYSIINKEQPNIVASYLNENLPGVFGDEEIEVNRGFDASKSNFGTAFLNKWNTNLAERHGDLYDLDDDSSLEKSDVMINNNDVTTLDLTARHIHLSPGLSADGESSATKCIRPQMSGYTNPRFLLANRQQQQQQQQLQEALNGNETLQMGGRQRNQIFLTSSSGGLSDSSQRRRPIVHSSTGTRIRTEDEDNEFYISCAEMQSLNSSLIVENNDTNRQEMGFSHLYNRPTVQANKSAQTESSLVSKLERLKQFKVMIFVDSIEDYSFDNNNDSSSPGPSYTNDLNLSNIPTVNYNRNFSMSSELEDNVFLSRNRETPTPQATCDKQQEVFKFCNIAINKSTFIQQNTGEYNSDSESRSPSLKEFETIERSQEKLQSIPKHRSPVITDDVFMYQTDNYNLANVDSHQALTSKPPLGPNVPAPNNTGNNNNNQKAEAPLAQLLNVSNQCLSTIEECSNETFESACSNHSRNLIHQKSHSTSYEEDAEDHLNSDWTIDKKALGDMSQNITLRRGGHKQRTVEQNDEEHTLQENQSERTLTGVSLNPTASDLATAVTITDKLFEKFCLLANDEIMAYPSLVGCSFTDSLEASAKVTDNNKWEKTTKESKINTKLLNEILDLHVSEPGSSARSSMSSHQKDSSINNGQKTEQARDNNSNNKANIFSSSSCSKLSSVTSKQTVVPVVGGKRDSNNSTVFGSINNLNGNQFKELDFELEDDEILDDDEVFLNEKNTDNISSESEINIDQKISSKSLNSINERKLYISNKASSLPPSATTISTEPSFPMLNASSGSTRSLTNRNNNKAYKHKQQQSQKNNLSTTTTLEISSYISDSLYNSNLVVTPMCSEAMSPALFTNHFLRSPNLPQNSPLLNSNSMFSTSLPNNPITPKTFTNLKSSMPPSPPPPAPININTNLAKQTKTAIFPSPPSMSIKCNSSVATPTDSSFPLPPTFLDSNNLKDKTSTLEIDLDSQSSNSTEPLVQTNSNLPATKKAPSVKQVNAPQKSTLIETLTARLNLATETKSGNPLGSLFNNKGKQKPMAPIAPNTSINLVNKTDWSKQSEVKSSPLRSNNHDDTANNALSDLNTADYNRGKLNATDEVDALCSVTDKKAANFGCSLYGLDTDEDEKSSMDKQLLNHNHRQEKCSAEELDSSLPLPPPPIGFDDNNNEVDWNKTGTNNYENVDFDYDLIEQISKEFQKKSAVKMLNASSSAHSPLFIDQSRNSNNCTVTSVSNDLLNEEPTKDWSTIPMSSQTSASTKNRTNNVTKNIDDMSQKHWKNLTCETLVVDHNKYTSLLPEKNLLEKQKLLENHMNGNSKTNNKIVNQNPDLHMSCPTVLSNNMNVANITKTSDVHDYKNDEFLDEITTLTSEGKREFKLDRLLDINPKRLYKGSKFRCRIHDVIDEAGRFWIEVIYSKEEERKFQEIFKLFRLCSRLSHPPASVHPKMRVSAFYKEDWHRAIVLEPTNQCIANNKVRVRFVDLGIVKILDRQTELREIDQKFFNCPLKALHCSINLDKDVFDPETCLYQNEELKQFRFSKMTRKYFTKIIFKRVLYVKVVNFTYECMDSDNNDITLSNGISGEKHLICQIILGAQFQRGVVDIFMYLLNKFDKPYYSVLKQYHNQQQKLVKNGVIQETDVESSYQDTQSCTQQTITATHNNNNNKRAEKDEAESDNAQGEPILNKELLQIMKDEFLQSYGKAIENNTPMEQEHAVISDINGGNDDEADFTEDDESTIEETEQPLYSNSVNHQDHRLHETFTISSDSSSESYFSVSDEDDFEEDEDEENDDLEHTPVRGFDTNNFSRSFNYSPLRIDSIHLPPIKSINQSFNTEDAKTPVNQYTEHSTAQVRGVDRKRPGEIKFTPIAIPLARPVKQSKPLPDYQNNASSDTDTSLVAPCCTGLNKLKWNSATKLRQKIITLNKSKECPELSFQMANENNYVRNKKVKFQIK